MLRSPKEWLGSLAFWTCYEVLTEGDTKHTNRDWASVSEEDNLKHLIDHTVIDDGKTREEEDLRHAVCRATMMYWSWLRDNNKLDKRLILSGALKDPTTGEVRQMEPLPKKEKK